MGHQNTRGVGVGDDVVKLPIEGGINGSKMLTLRLRVNYIQFILQKIFKMRQIFGNFGAKFPKFNRRPPSVYSGPQCMCFSTQV